MITPTLDFELIKNIVLSDDVFNNMAEDGVQPDEILESNFTNKGWLVFSVDEKPIGVIAIKTLNDSSIMIHPYLLNDYRKQGLGQQMMREFFEFFIHDMPKKFIKVNCKIAVCFSDTIKFAKKLGFVDEGTDRMSFIKYGSIWDQKYLGMTRLEIEEKLT